MDFLQRTPFFRLFLGLVSGIITFPFVPISLPVLYVAVVSCLVIIAVSFFVYSKSDTAYRFRWFFGVGILVLLFAFGQILSAHSERDAAFYPLNEKSSYYVEITSAPVEKPKSYRAEVTLKYYLQKKSWKPAQGSAVVYFEKSIEAKKRLIGDRLLLYTQFKMPPGAENPGGFDYKTYLKRNGIAATAYVSNADWKFLGADTAFSLRRFATQLRLYVLDIFRHYNIRDHEFAVLSALTVGYTDELSPDIRASYSASGAMHILSVSGLHVGIVYVVLAFLLGFLKKSRFQLILKTILIVGFLWSYALLTGLSPSVVRASLMFSLVAVGAALERKSQIYNTVFMSAFFMLLMEPDYIYNIGFQLSYTAVLSIVLFQKPISGLLPVRNKIAKWLRDLFAVSLAAQIGTLPFTLYYFQQFPNYFLLTNLVAIPLSSGIIYLAILLLAVSSWSVISIPVAYVLQKLLFGLNYCISAIYEMPFSTSILSLNFAQSLLLVAFIAFFSMYIYAKKFNALFSALISVLIILVFTLVTFVKTKLQPEIHVYAASNGIHVGFLENGNCYFYSSDSVYLQKLTSANFHLKGINALKSVENVSWFSDNYANFRNKRIVILAPKHWKMKTPDKPLNVDILIIGNKLKPKMNYLLENLHPKIIVVDKSISAWYTENIRKACYERHIRFYSIADKGAFVYSIQN